MSYNWQNGELITAEKLNQTGDGLSDTLIVNVTHDYDQGTVTFDKTYQELLEAGNSGKTILFKTYDGIHNLTSKMPAEDDEDEGNIRIGFRTIYWHPFVDHLEFDLDEEMLTVDNVVLSTSYQYRLANQE